MRRRSVSPSLHSVRGAAPRVLIMALLLAFAALSLAACGSDSSGGAAGDSSGGGDEGDAVTQTDSFLAAWPEAQESMAQLADDAVLLSAGTGGLALADVPSSWNFIFFSPGTRRVYSVAVEHGEAQEAQDLGKATKDTDVGAAVDVEAIDVGGADAVVMAREFGEKSGSVPKNVMVGGAFAELPGAADLDMQSGVWTITFASGTDLADAQKYAVDMMTGEVTAVED